MSGHLIDDSPLTSFHKKLALYSSGGPFIDGYALTIVGVALITLEPALSLSSTEIGLIGAASLVGVFVGGMFFGYLTDRIGRQFMYIADLIALALFSILSAFAGEAWTSCWAPCSWPGRFDHWPKDTEPLADTRIYLSHLVVES